MLIPMRFLLVLFAFLILAPTALALEPVPGYTIDRSADAQLNSEGDILYTEKAPEQWQEMLDRSAEIWGKEPSCPNGIDMRVMTATEDNVIAKAVLGGCQMWVNTNSIDGNENKYYRDRCLTIAHEYGHLLGYEHTQKGLMAADTAYSNSLDIPECGPKPEPGIQFAMILLLIFVGINLVQLLGLLVFLLL